MRLSLSLHLLLLVVAGFIQNDQVSVQAFGLSSSSASARVVSRQASSSFAPGMIIRSRTRSNTRQTSATSLSMVFDKMSNECVAAMKEAQDIGTEIGLDVLRTEVLFAGVVARPERAGRTLAKYSLEALEVKEAVIQTLTYKTGITLGEPSLSSSKEPLPFSDDARIVLNKALQIAERMESKTLRSEHVLLALMGYNNGNKIETVPILEVLGDLTSLKRAEVSFSVSKFCDELVNALPMTPVGTADVIVQDQVAIGSQRGGGSTNTLSEVGVDLTQMAMEGKLDMVFGRDNEIRTALRTLGRRRKNNPCLIGDPGVGKTAVAEGIAQVLANGILEMQEETKIGSKIASRFGKVFNRGKNKQDGADEDKTDDIDYDLPNCPASLLGARLISIELAGLVAGTSNRGDFEQKIKSLIKEASENNVILFIDEIHNLIGTGGGGDGALNAANILKPALARGELRLLGATTTPEYRRYIEKDGALERRFQPLEVKEPTVYETLDILAAISPKYEEFHGVEYTYNALLYATKLSNRYISDRFLPDKAIDLIDEAGSMVKMAEGDAESFFVTEDAIGEVISEITGIPLGKLDTDEKARLKNLEEELEARVKGQSPAVRSVAKSIRRARSGMRDGKRPVASLLFCGPTGVGKTELCKALAETYYGQEKDIIRIDGSEYMDRFSTSRLIGAPPGYVGYDEGGQLTEAVRRAPHSIILFDELEKAHEDVLNILLQIMDEGTLTDGKGRTISFKNNIFVMTSNIGSKDILEVAKTADPEADGAQLTTDVVKAALEEAMRPELLNRIDEIIVFSPLDYDNLKAISRNLIANTVDRAKEDQNIKLAVSDNIAEIVTREALGVSSVYGARPIRRAVQRYLEDTLAEAIMSDFINEGDEVSVNLRDPNSGKKVVEIKRMLDGESVVIDVDEDAGINKESLDFEATYGDLPDLDAPPPQEPDSFQ